MCCMRPAGERVAQTLEMARERVAQTLDIPTLAHGSAGATGKYEELST